jgi:membrane protease YdiL (CAAX protease family)
MFPLAPSNLRPLDFILMAILLAALPLWGYFVSTPKMRKSLEAGTFDPVRTYVRAFITLWALTLFLAIDWWTAGRDPKALGLAVQFDTRFMVSGLLTVAVVVLFIQQFIKVRRFNDERKRKIVEKNARAFEIAPSNARQLLYFVGLSVTAGVTEELLYRGFLIWSLTAYMNIVLAAVLASALFGLGHAYQGVSGIVKTGGVGLVMAILYIGSGTILLPMILHVFVDVHNGWLIFSLKSSLKASPLSLSGEPGAGHDLPG